MHLMVFSSWYDVSMKFGVSDLIFIIYKLKFGSVVWSVQILLRMY